jgi:hypothetical protein
VEIRIINGINREEINEKKLKAEMENFHSLNIHNKKFLSTPASGSSRALKATLNFPRVLLRAPVSLPHPRSEPSSAEVMRKAKLIMSESGLCCCEIGFLMFAHTFYGEANGTRRKI